MAEARYQQICNDLRQQIINGHFVPGDMLPSENDLAAQYDTSRVTIRKSLNLLENQQIIHPQHGRGYFVNKPEHKRYTLIYDDLINTLDSRLQYINLIRADQEVHEALNVKEGQWVVSILRTLRSPQRVLVCDQIYLPYQKGMPLIEAEIKYAEFPDMVKNKTSEFSVYTRMEIGLEAVSGEIAHRLDLPEGTGLMVIYRYLIDNLGQTMAFGKQYLHESCGRIVAHSVNREINHVSTASV